MFGLESMVKSMLESSGINIEELIKNGNAQIAHIIETVDRINYTLQVIDARTAAIAAQVGVTSMSEHLLAPIPDAPEVAQESEADDGQDNGNTD